MKKETKKCLYCGKKGLKQDEVYFPCPICGNGMCEECYENLQGTDEQVFDIDELDDMEDGFYSFVLSKSGGCTRLICYECLEKLDVEFRKKVKGK